LHYGAYRRLQPARIEDTLDQDPSRRAYGITTAWFGHDASEAVIDAGVRCLEQLR
jgi:hypothetical protein